MWPKIIVLLMTSSVGLVGSCLTYTYLSQPAGTARATADATNYRGAGSEVDHCWVIRTTASVAIKLTYFIFDSICSTAHLHEMTVSPSNSTERFRLRPDDLTLSEFWLPSPVLIRCKNNGANWISGFEFSYRAVASFNVAFVGLGSLRTPSVGIIKEVSGQRTSHPGFSNYHYFNDIVEAWSIHAESYQTVHINIELFESESGYDMLHVFNGIFPTVTNESIFNITGGPHRNAAINATGSVTLVFRTDGLSVRSGFLFQFSVCDGFCSDCAKPNIQTMFHHWTGKASNGTFISLLHHDIYHVDYCFIWLSCSENAVPISPLHYSHGYKSIKSVLHLGSLSRNGCIRQIKCRLYGVSALQDLKLPSSDPETARIELMQPELWSLTRVIQFRVVSESTCAFVRHQCELTTTSDVPPIVAKQLETTVSDPVGSSCLSSVVTHFAIVAHPSGIASSAVIKCRLLNGSFALLKLPSPNTAGVRVAEVWERPVLITSLLIAILVIVALIVFSCAAHVRPSANRQSETATEMPAAGRVAAFNPNQTIACGPAIKFDEVYVE